MIHFYSVCDRLSGVFSPPFVATSTPDAMRTVYMASTDEKSKLKQYVGDYDLYFVGSFADDTGCFVSLDNPQLICSLFSLRPPTSLDGGSNV